ncbi:hypothetical protein [Streptomyces sp. NPDC057509]|uniref:hypothetical protein n=1 Tax=Streptomyces sp. NPDC057509 TaxID=3346152 RepID=UPI0036904CE6
MTYTLADAVRAQFERDHPHGKNTLFCADGFRRVKDRLAFRETPWHGRAARCLNCEGYGIGGGNSLWKREIEERTLWELEQARIMLGMYRRYVGRLRAERYDGAWVAAFAATGPTSADVFEAYEAPWKRAVEARRQKWAPVIAEALSKAHTDHEEES